MTRGYNLILNHGSQKLPWRTALLTVLAAGAYFVFGSAPEAWVFDREAISQGEFWRLASGHWVHSDFEHGFWNIGALGLLGMLFENQLKWRLPVSLIFGSRG